jgi:hypothetical protein
VAEGCEFSDGSVALRWRGDNPATAVWPDLDSVLAVHGHQGATEVRWIDPQPKLSAPQPKASVAPSKLAGGIEHLFDDVHQVRPPSALTEPLPPPGHARGWAGARHLR